MKVAWIRIRRPPPTPSSMERIKKKAATRDELLLSFITLLYQIETSTDEVGEGFASEESVLKECEVDELMDEGIVLGVVADGVGLLLPFGFDVLVHLLQFVLAFLTDFVVFLVFIALVDGILASGQSLDFCLDWLEGSSAT